MITEIKVPEIDALMKKLDHLETLITVNVLGGKNTVAIADIAKFEGVSKALLYQPANAYLLPRFGKSAYQQGAIRWDVQEYLEWRQIEPSKRKEMYEQYLRRELKKDQIATIKKHEKAKSTAQEKKR